MFRQGVFMINLKSAIMVAIAGAFLTACATTDLNDYEKVMVDKTWITTKAIDNNKRSINESDQRVSMYYGTAKYDRNGTFVMYTPSGEKKLQGDWNISEDGKTRTLVAKDDEGNTLFTRDVDNTVVAPTSYVYRIYPTENNKNQYIDIFHEPK